MTPTIMTAADSNATKLRSHCCHKPRPIDMMQPRTKPLEPKRYIMNSGRSTKQGQQINIGKDSPEYRAIVSTMSMHPEDMKAAGIASGSTVRVRSEFGEATFQCIEGKVPQGMIFCPYGPPSCRVMGTYTDGTGMPTSKGWEVEVEPIDA